jgi:hypothetical protein
MGKKVELKISNAVLQQEGGAYLISGAKCLSFCDLL